MKDAHYRISIARVELERCVKEREKIVAHTKASDEDFGKITENGAGRLAEDVFAPDMSSIVRNEAGDLVLLLEPEEEAEGELEAETRTEAGMENTSDTVPGIK